MNAPVQTPVSAQLLVSVAFSPGPAKNTSIEARSLTFEDLAAMLANPQIGEKGGSYYIRGGDLTAPKREDKNLRSADLLILDGDGRIDPATGEVLQGAPPMERATAVLDRLGLAYIAHTSHTYDPGVLEKWRIIIPAKLKHETDLLACVGYITSKLHAAGVLLEVVKEMKVWSQPWYLPRVRDAKALAGFKYLANLDGQAFPVGDAIRWYVTNDDEVDPPRGSSAAAAEDGNRSVIKQFNADHGLDWVRGELQAHGYKFSHHVGAKNQWRYIAPGSSTGAPGVTVFRGTEGDWCAYSHHGAHDPISAKKLVDPFGLYALFYHGDDAKAAAKALWAEDRSRNSSPSNSGEKAGTAKAGPGSAPARQGIILRNGKPVANVANVLTVLRTSPAWHGVVAFDRMAAKVMLQSPVPDVSGRKPNNFQPRILTDGDIVKAVEWFQHNEMPSISTATVGDGLAVMASENGFDPLEDKLRSLSWDGVPRIENWLQTYCGANPTETQPEDYIKAVGRCWLISAAARALRPGCKVDSALVLVGPQGIGKSTAGRILAYDWFSDGLPPVHSKDASDHLRGVWLVEFGEMATASKADVEEMKAFVTRTVEKFRPAYGRLEVEYPRRNVFFGTSNRDAFLKDETGNRRFWPVVVTAIDADRLKADRDQLWAEAVLAFDKGQQWHLTEEESRLAAVQQAAFVVTDDRTELLARALQGKTHVTSIECLGLLEMKNEKREQMEIAGMLRALGWSKRTNGVQKFWVAPLTTSTSERWSEGGQSAGTFG